jgi:RNA 3'-terminal phosphate cyclase (ATP)
MIERREMIKIDGSYGEGGGQVLRTALTLALMTGQSLRIDNIRAGRKKPGLRPQHLQAVKSCVKISQGSADGARLGAFEILFRPGKIRAGRYHFDIGTAGATSLVLQTVFLPLCLAGTSGKKSRLTITGGTHVPWSPCFHYLDLQWLSFLRQMGLDAELSLEQAGFYPQGGGRLQASLRSVGWLRPLNLLERGPMRQIRGVSAVANLPRDIAKRQRQRVVSRLGASYPLNDIRTVQLSSHFKGTFLLLLAEFEHGQACYFGLGAPGKRAEAVADEAIDELEAFLSSDGVIDPYLADQLLLPLVFADGPSKIRTSKVTQHLLTNAEIIQQFLPLEINIDGQLNQAGTVSIDPRKPVSSNP